MNKDVYAIIAELGKPADERNPDLMNKLASELCSEGPSDIKRIVNDYLEQNPGALADIYDNFDEDDLEPDIPESLKLSSPDKDKLKKLLNP
ncbi:MAG: hypothetical protein HRT89_12545 [Lentisphaeria bacterium]|nr:hypothetical protein [Lentisphaeria bacterium]NQZ68886.1 hypothetical protein [Lentisphaeria bacterium]